MHAEADVTRLLAAYSDGDQAALDRLLPLLYEELRRMARSRLRDERPDHTLDTAGLVHEAYLKLVDVRQVRWQSRSHFLAMASRVMRRILINYARDRKAAKRGAGAPKEALDEDALLLPEPYAEALLDLDDALRRFEAVHPRPGRVVECRYFGGLTNAETAEVLGVAVSTVERDLRFARAWLAREWGADL